MKAIDIQNGKGPRSALFLNDRVPTPEPKEGEALVRVHAFGINRMDILQREGLYPLPPQAPPTLGVEFSGTVKSLGGKEPSGDSCGFKVGDEVFGLAYGGAYAEYVAVSTKMLLKKPPSMSWEVAAGIPETWITAIQTFSIAPIRPGSTILLHAGASAVSQSAAQLAHHLGASAIYATAGTDAKCAHLVSHPSPSLRVTAAFNYRTTDWRAAVLSATSGRGVDVVVDFVGADYFQNNIDVCATDGRIVMLGLLSGGKVSEGLDISGILRKRVGIEGSTLRSRDLDYQKKLRDELERCLPLFEDGGFTVVVERVMSWREIQEAHGLLEENKTTGKIVCLVN